MLLLNLKYININGKILKYIIEYSEIEILYKCYYCDFNSNTKDNLINHLSDSKIKCYFLKKKFRFIHM